ncbi:hypothetical protein GOP47_0020118 [Adiantum capillus-veneris]|uniref:Uncharacterized protein n=1 Tax=Adiantum capillus-veneris TaxID=13818 RepID=A0A9D4Z7Q0_ADICA|nr:hypothetical protein GOP47_0020118 [Adiantum capillus-veneris]
MLRQVRIQGCDKPECRDPCWDTSDCKDALSMLRKVRMQGCDKPECRDACWDTSDCRDVLSMLRQVRMEGCEESCVSHATTSQNVGMQECRVVAICCSSSALHVCLLVVV